MLFTSYGFLGFIAILFLLYYSIPKRFQWPLLLAASYLFYAIANPKYLIYIAATTVSTYFAAYKMQQIKERQDDYLAIHKKEMNREEKKAYKQKNKSNQRKWLIFCLLFNFGILAVVKYTNFVIANINYLIDKTGQEQALPFLNLVLPMGISFYTFQSMSYLIDVYRSKYKAEYNLGKFALFVSFFPQLVQGPISRFDDLSKTLFSEHAFDKKQISFGLQRILWGFFKKLVIADRILVGVNTIIRNPDQYQGVFVLVGMLFYAFELYADFTGGIDITIGVAQVLGVEVKENFIRPYFSKSIKEYWRRWHITMGTWFTDYIFYPISVSQPMLKLSRFSRKYLGEFIGKRLPVYLSSGVVWFTTGIWHGASWNFIVWGLMNYVVIMISQEFEPFYAQFHKKFQVEGKFWFRLFQVIRTVLLMSALRLFDCYRDVPLTFRMFGNMFTKFYITATELFHGSLLQLGLSIADYIVLAVSLLILTAVSLAQRNGSVREKIAKKPIVLRYTIWYGLFLIVLILGAYGVGYDASQFIYNQF